MQLTDDEIREILIREKKAKKKRKKKRRRIGLIIAVILIVILGVGIFMNKDVLYEPRGVIFVDAGHGGVDGGSYVNGRKEKDDTLKLALEVENNLEDMGFTVVMSRRKDKDVDRAERGKMANKNKAQLFISIHRNQANEGEGVEVYIPSKNDKPSRMLGENVFNALVQQGFQERRVRVGTLITEKDDYLENSVPTMPSCLVEVGFISNKGDNKLYDDNLEANGLAVAQAIEKTFRDLYEEDNE